MINFLLTALARVIPWRLLALGAMVVIGATLVGVDLANLAGIDLTSWTWSQLNPF